MKHYVLCMIKCDRSLSTNSATNVRNTLHCKACDGYDVTTATASQDKGDFLLHLNFTRLFIYLVLSQNVIMWHMTMVNNHIAKATLQMSKDEVS